MQRDFRVVSIGLVGKRQTPTVTLKSEDRETLTLHLEDKAKLSDYKIDQLRTVKIVKEQATL